MSDVRNADDSAEQVELPICWRCERPIQLGAEVIVGIGRVSHATCHLPPVLVACGGVAGVIGMSPPAPSVERNTGIMNVDRPGASHNCWFCHGWGNVEKRATGKTAWSDAAGGERGQRFPIFNLLPAFGVVPSESELIECPVCR